MGRVEVLQFATGAGEDAVGVEAEAAGVDVFGGSGGDFEGGEEGVCEGDEGGWGGDVRDDGSGDHGGEGVCGEEDWGHGAV